MARLAVCFFAYFCGLAIMAQATSTIPTIKLASGYEMPVIGLGTFLLDPADVDLTVTTALESGYKHIDTAFVYLNEKEIGQALKKWFDKGGKREDLFITTKLPPYGNKASEVEKYLKLSLEYLGLQYVDLYLIHLPIGVGKDKDKYDIGIDDGGNTILDYGTNHVEIWKAMEAQVKAGLVRSIGISNFNESQVENIFKNAEIKPSNLQVELHMYHQQKPLRDLCAKRNISVTAYSTFGSPGLTFNLTSKIAVPQLKHPVVLKIAEAHKKSAGQVLLRHAIQSGLIVIPKSKTPKRIKENLDVFDFSLTADEMKELNDLDQGDDGRRFNFLNFKGLEKHPEYPFLDEIKK